MQIADKIDHDIFSPPPDCSDLLIYYFSTEFLRRQRVDGTRPKDLRAGNRSAGQSGQIQVVHNRLYFG